MAIAARGEYHSRRARGGLNAADGAVSGGATREREFAATQVVLATDAPSAARLMRPLPELGELRRRLTRLEYEPITTLYFRYPKPVALRPAMQGYAERLTQWLFDRRITGHDNVLAAVISAGREHMAWDKEELVRHVMRDIQSAAAQDTAALSAPIATLVIREKRATFAATPTMDALRPPQQTALRGLVLAGDYTQTGYPATLEGAVRSGIRAAEALA